MRFASADSAFVGEIYQLRFPATTTVIASTHALINELCDEKRFVKIPTGALAVGYSSPTMKKIRPKYSHWSIGSEEWRT